MKPISCENQARPLERKIPLTMSMMLAMLTMKMAAMAQVLRAQRVWSIQVENDTSFFG